MPVPHQPDAGFTLAEVAIALSIIAAVIGLLVPAFLAIRSAEQGRASQGQLEAVLRAVAAFVQANGCVPCPTPALRIYSAGHGVVRGDRSASAAPCGSCVEAVGAVPFKSLGISEVMARDGYGSWLTYATDVALASSADVVVPPTSPCQTGDSASLCSAADITNGTRKKGLCRSGISASGRLNVTLFFGVTQQAAVLVMSHGANKRGAYTARPTSSNLRMAFPTAVPACSSLQGFERCNADGDINFIANVNANPENDPFDDRVMYFDRNALVSYLGGPACQTA
jgi:prepilin-type N-terminal cleavage/methylation domain-containing protein